MQLLTNNTTRNNVFFIQIEMCKSLASCIIFILNLIIFIGPIISLRRKFYYIEHEQTLNWDDAQKFCFDMGMHLFTLDDEYEYELLKNLIQKKYGTFLPYWTDARKVNDTFIWHSRGEPITFLPWFKGEPNNSSGIENCIHSIWNSFEWNDRRCDFEARFICEYDL